MAKDESLVSYKAGDIIFQDKTPSEHLYVIKEGQVGIFKKAKNGEMIPVSVIGSSEFVGEISLLTDSPHSSIAKALTDVKAVKIPKAAIEAQVKASSQWVQALLKSSISRLQKTNEMMKNNNLVDEKLKQKVESIEANGKKSA